MGATAGIMMAVSGGIQAVGAIQQARAQQQAANYNKAVSERNANIARQQTEADVISLRKKQYQQFGALRAAVAASGVTIEGSPLDLLESSVIEAELDIQRLEYSGELKAAGYEGDADLYSMQAKNAKTAGYFNAASSLLMGAGDMYSYPSPNPGTPVQVAGTR
jgi:hypothetical protein